MPGPTVAAIQRWKPLLGAARARAKRYGASLGNVGTRSLLGYWRRCGIDHDRCFYCRKRPSRRLSIIQPLNHGGVHDRTNYVPTCDPCDEYLDRMSAEDRVEFLMRYKLGYGLIAPKPKPKPAKTPQALKNPRTVAEWDAWEKERRRARQI